MKPVLDGEGLEVAGFGDAGFFASGAFRLLIRGDGPERIGEGWARSRGRIAAHSMVSKFPIHHAEAGLVLQRLSSGRFHVTRPMKLKSMFLKDGLR